MKFETWFKLVLSMVLSILIVGVGCLYVLGKNKAQNSPYIARCELGEYKGQIEGD